MAELSLSKQGDADPALKKRQAPLLAFPVENQPGHYAIDGELVGPETVFSYSRTRLKGRPYRKAKAYVLAESQRKRGAFVCELGDHYVTEETGEVHHRVRKDCHVAKALGLACHSHNAAHGDPQARTTETVERESIGGPPPLASSLESAKHDPQREAWNELVRKGDAFKELKRMGCETLTLQDGEYVLASDLAKIAVSMTVDKTFGKYSSETFGRYEREDRFDTLQMVKEKGRWWVKKRTADRQPVIPNEPPKAES